MGPEECRRVPGTAGTPDTATDVDARWMRHALALAERAAAQGEVPVGAVVVREGQVLGEGWNQPIAATDPTAHAEVVALREAARATGNYRLPGATLYVTLEPCLMCAGAMIHARIQRLVFAASDPKRGTFGGRCNALDLEGLNHSIQASGGVLADPAGERLRTFFQRRRARE